MVPLEQWFERRPSEGQTQAGGKRLRVQEGQQMGDRGGSERGWREWKEGRGSRQQEAPEEGFLIGRLGSFPTWVRGLWLQGNREQACPPSRQPRGQGGGGGWVQLLKCCLPLVWSLFPRHSLEADA